MKINKNKRGITLIVLTVTIIVMTILLTAVTISGVGSINNAKKLKFGTELCFMQEMVDSYKLNNEGTYPVNNIVTLDISGVTNKARLQFDGEVINSNKVTLYEINGTLLGKTDTIYGNKKSFDDIYAVSKDTGRVYFVKGLKVAGNTYYTLTEDLKKKTGYIENTSTAINRDGIIFTPSTLEWTSKAVNTTVKVPLKYTNVSVTVKQTGKADVTLSGTANGAHIIYTANTLGVYEILVTYKKIGDLNNYSQTFNVLNYDDQKPSLSFGEQKKVKQNGENSSFVYINIANSTDDKSGVKVIKYENVKLNDSQKNTYFKTNGAEVKENVIKISDSSSYVTVYIEDNAGNFQIYERAVSAMPTYENYIKDGLVLLLDGQNNTLNGHSTDTTIWKDLSGNGNDATLHNFKNTENSGWGSNKLVFDGINNCASVENSQTLKIIDQTIEIVVNKKAVVKNNRSIFFVKWYGYTMEFNPDNSISYGRSNVGQAGYLKANETSQLGRTTHIGGTFNGKTQNIYINGKKSNSQNVTSAGNVDNASLTIGTYRDNCYLNGEIYSIRMYNKQLTDEQIAQNYEIDKVRFGL
ncbi:MAG: LamG-like jellyroll fold domain-containing protein [Clostridia bacterium]